MFRNFWSVIRFKRKRSKPRRRNNLGDVLTFLLASGVVIFILLLPSVNVSLRNMFSGHVRPALNAGMTVWASKDAGVYYCPGSRLYGSGVGVYMKQGDALTKGYQPVLGNYCNPGNKKVAKKHIATRRNTHKRRSTSAAKGSDALVSDRLR